MLWADFCKLLNESKWRGWINEVGFGSLFQSEFLLEPGASKTIISTASKYDKRVQHIAGFRSVSEAGSLAFADKMYHSEFKDVAGIPGYENLFSLSITGAHKKPGERGASHAWVSIVRYDRAGNNRSIEENSIHISLDKKMYSDRRQAAYALCSVVLKFMVAALELDNEYDFKSFVEDYAIFDPRILNVDVLNGGNLPIEERLKLFSSGKVLAFSNGEMVRPEDLLRGKKKIYRGSFNPPTKSHNSIGYDALYEISLHNARKGVISYEDIAHRIKMLNLLGKKVIVSDATTFENLHSLLRDRYGLEEGTYLTGLDTLNAVVDPKWYNEPDKAMKEFEPEGSARFIVFERDDLTVNRTSIEKRINYSFTSNHDYDPTASSSKARAGYLSVCPIIISSYIEEFGLYNE